MPLSNFMVSSKRLSLQYSNERDSSEVNRDDLVLRVEKEELGNEVGIRQHHYDVLFFWYLIGFVLVALMLAQAQLSGNLIIPSLMFLCWFVALCTMEKDLLIQLNPTHVKSWIVEEAHNSKFFILANFVTSLQTCFPTRVFQGCPRRFKRKLKNLWGRLHKSRLHCFKEFEEAGISGR